MAYQVFGYGPVDLVFAPGYVSNIELGWSLTGRMEFLEALASFARVIQFDKRGTGMSDPVEGHASIETRMEDDRAWRGVLGHHHALVRRQLARFRGRELDTAGDGFFASFDGPARAIRCAGAIIDSVRAELGVEVRAGVHTGECEVVDGKVAGIAVHTGARVASLADAGEVLVSSTVKDLVAGSGIKFEDRGTHGLKGVGEWRVYALQSGA